MLLRVAICDDIPVFAEVIENLILEYNSSLFEVDVFNNPFRLIELLKTNTYDLFILDIEFADISGIEIAEAIREQNLSCPIIFVTSFNEYMERAFKVNTFDYILKPVTRDKLYPALNRTIKYLNLDDSKFTFTFNKVFYSLSHSEIVYFEKNKRRVLIHTASTTYETLLQTNALLSKIDNNFIQVHTSFIVNARHIKKVSSNSITAKLDGNKTIEIPMSRKFLDSARKQILMKIREVM